MKGCAMEDRIQNAAIRQELNINWVLLQAEIYKERWKEHVFKIQIEGIPKLALNNLICRSVGRQD